MSYDPNKTYLADIPAQQEHDEVMAAMRNASTLPRDPTADEVVDAFVRATTDVINKWLEVAANPATAFAFRSIQMEIIDTAAENTRNFVLGTDSPILLTKASANEAARGLGEPPMFPEVEGGNPTTVETPGVVHGAI